MPSEWFYTVNGQQADAPANAAQLKQMASAGQIQPTDLVWQEGMANWAPASTIKGLFPSAGRPEPAPVLEVPAAVVKAPRRRRKADDDEDDDAPSSSGGGGIVGLHPLLVLLLSICTFGLFGLLYAFLVVSAYPDRLTRQADAAGRPLGKARHPLGVLLLSYFTFGLYFYYWAYSVMRECAAYAGRDASDSRTDLTLMLLFPPYGVYVVVFRLPELIRAAQAVAKVPESTAVNHSYMFLNPCLFPGLPLLSMAQQDALNQVWFTAP